MCAGLIPYPHHNQSPRNTYQCAMGKQAMGTVALNQHERLDSLLYTLIHPQKPMVKTRVLDLINFDQIPGGQNACIAVMSYTGYDIEDAVVLNQGSVDRGFGRCMVLRKHQCAIRKYANGASDRSVGPPDPEAYKQGERDERYQKYASLDDDGICLVGTRLESGAVMVNKYTPTDISDDHDREAPVDGTGASGGVAYKPTPLTYRAPAPSFVDKVLSTTSRRRRRARTLEHQDVRISPLSPSYQVLITSNESDQFLIKILLRQCRRPEVGDKFSSRHGQKGVCGVIIPQADMPFDERGVCPDLVMNPHGFPSRMTVGKLIELVAGKAGVLEGRQAYGTAFGEAFGNADRVIAASETLVRKGFSYVGKDLFTSGVSGEPLLGYIFAGPVFYQKLQHMVMDKMHARAAARAAPGSRPRADRATAACASARWSATASSRTAPRRSSPSGSVSSDAFTANVCEVRPPRLLGLVPNCRSGEQITDIRLPYACKLLFQELQSMNIVPRLELAEM